MVGLCFGGKWLLVVVGLLDLVVAVALCGFDG